MLELIIYIVNDSIDFLLPFFAATLVLKTMKRLRKFGWLAICLALAHTVLYQIFMDGMRNDGLNWRNLALGLLTIACSYAVWGLTLFAAGRRWLEALVLLLCFLYVLAFIKVIASSLSVMLTPETALDSSMLRNIGLTALEIFLCWAYVKWARTKSFWQDFPKKVALFLAFLIVVGDALNIMSIAAITDGTQGVGIFFSYLTSAFPFLLLLILAVGIIAGVSIHKQSALLENEKRGQEYYHLMMDKMNELNILKHDLKNHLATAKAIDDGAQRAYIDDIKAQLDDVPRTEWCGNMVANAVMTNANIRAREKGVSIDADILLDGQCGIAAVDLSAALANLMDNAIEASERGDTIAVKIRHAAGAVTVSITNPLKVGRKLPTRKERSTKEGPGHGLGIPSVKRIARIYSGEYRLERSGQEVVATLILCSKADEASVSMQNHS